MNSMTSCVRDGGAHGRVLCHRYRRWFAVVVGTLLLTGCRPPRRETARELQPAARSWAEAHGLPLESERALEALVGDARVLGLGEAAHGSSDVFEARASITKRLIEVGWVTAIVLENDAWQTCAVNRYVQGKTSDASALREDLIGLYQHAEARAFFAWLREFNSSAEQPVEVFGLDAQSDAACRVDLPTCSLNRKEHCAQANALRSNQALAATSYWLRDELMAANVLRVLDDVGSGVVLWVHSGHASKSAPMLAWNVRRTAAPMGQHLVDTLGTGYTSADVTFVAGDVAAGNAGGRLFRLRPRRRVATENFALAAAPSETLEGTLVAGEATVYSLAGLPIGTDATGWFSTPHFARSIGSMMQGWRARKGSAYDGWDKVVPREAFDTIVVLPATRPIAFDFD